MTRKLSALMMALLLPMMMQAQKELKVENPHTTLFLMNDGMFVGNKGVMCGQSGAIAITYDEGQHWTTRLVSPYLYFKQVYMDDTLSIWLLSDSLLLHSDDGGINFTQMYAAETDYKLLRFRKSGNTSFLLAIQKNQYTTSRLIRNSNQWTGTSDIITLPFYAKDFDFSDETHGVITDYDYLYKTSDGGNTWQNVYGSGEDYHFKKIYHTTGNIFFALGYYYAPGAKSLENSLKDKVISYARAWKSTDGGTTWDYIVIPSDIAQNGDANSLAWRNEDTLIMGLQMDGEENNKWPVCASFDGGLTWNACQPSPDVTLSSYYPKSAWVMVSPNRFFAWESALYKALTSSVDGIHFSFEDDIVTAQITDFTRNGMYIPDASRFLINKTSSYSFLESAADGQPFDTIAGTSLYPSGILNKIAFADKIHGMVVSPKTSLVTSDGGENWQRYDKSCPGCILVDFSYPSPTAAYKLIKYPDANNPGQFLWKIAKSTDQGQSWIDIALPEVDLYQMIFVNAQKGYLFGENVTTGEWGYYKTTDGANQWNWTALPTNIFVTLADIVEDSITFLADPYRMFRLVMHESGYDLAEIALPVGKLAAMDFTDRYHGVIVMEDSIFSQAYWTDDAGESWHAYNMELPNGLTGVTLCNNLLNGYIFGLRNVLIHIDDGLPLGRLPVEKAKNLTWPNPAIDITEFSGNGPTLLEITTITGQTIYRKTVNLPYRLSLKGWQEGLYFYRLLSSSQKMSGKFIKVGKN